MLPTFVLVSPRFCRQRRHGWTPSLTPVPSLVPFLPVSLSIPQATTTPSAARAPLPSYCLASYEHKMAVCTVQSDSTLQYTDLRSFIDLIDAEWEMDALSDDEVLIPAQHKSHHDEDGGALKQQPCAKPKRRRTAHLCLPSSFILSLSFLHADLALELEASPDQETWNDMALEQFEM